MEKFRNNVIVTTYFATSVLLGMLETKNVWQHCQGSQLSGKREEPGKLKLN